MRTLNRLLLCLCISASFIILACASTTVDTVWKNDNYQAKLKKVLVIGVAKTPSGRRFFEDEFVRQLKTGGTNAIASYTVMPSDREISKDELLPIIGEQSIDSVLIARLVDKKTVETYVPGSSYAPPSSYYRGWHGHYSRSYGYMYSPGYTVTNEVVVIETNLYETKDEQLIWSAISETFIEGSRESLVRSFIKIIIKNLTKSGLVG